MDEVKEFRNKYLGEFTKPSPAYLKAYELRIYYEYKCEIYDRSVCTGPIGRDGEIMPADYRERGLINKYAAEIRNYIIREGQIHGAYFDLEAWRRAKEDVRRLSWNGIQEEYKRIFGKVGR